MKKRQRYFSLSEAAKVLGVSRMAVHHAIKEKRLPARRGVFMVTRTVATKTRGWQISARDLDQYKVSLLHQWIGKKSE